MIRFRATEWWKKGVVNVASISLEGVTKVYPNGYEAIHGLDLEIADGELMVVVGPSGCGKTTVCG